MIKQILSFLLVILALTSCSLFKGKGGEEAEKNYSPTRRTMEQEAQKRLAQARTALAQGQSEQARTIVKQMRKDCYLALAAREEGILLMDSIDLFDARIALVQADSLRRTNASSADELEEAKRKVEFYVRKIQYDRTNKQKK